MLLLLNASRARSLVAAEFERSSVLPSVFCEIPLL